MAYNITPEILEPDNWSKMKVKPAEAIMSPRVAEGLIMTYNDSQVRPDPNNKKHNIPSLDSLTLCLTLSDTCAENESRVGDGGGADEQGCWGAHAPKPHEHGADGDSDLH